MDKKTRENIRKILMEQKTQLEKDIENLVELAQPVSPDNAIGRITRMEALNDLTVHKANLSKAKKRMELLEKAERRLESEDFGLCLRCEEEIQIKRLELLPESQICMNCINKKGS